MTNTKIEEDELKHWGFSSISAFKYAEAQKIINDIQKTKNDKDRNSQILLVVREVEKRKLKVIERKNIRIHTENNLEVVKEKSSPNGIIFEVTNHNKIPRVIVIPQKNPDGTLSKTNFDVLELDEKGQLIALSSANLYINDKGEVKERQGIKTQTQLDKDWLKQKIQDMQLVANQKPREDVKKLRFKSKAQARNAIPNELRNRDLNLDQLKHKGKKDEDNDIARRDAKPKFVDSAVGNVDVRSRVAATQTPYDEFGILKRQKTAIEAEAARLRDENAGLQAQLAQAAAAQADVARLQDELRAAQAKNAESDAKAAELARANQKAARLQAENEVKQLNYERSLSRIQILFEERLKRFKIYEQQIKEGFALRQAESEAKAAAFKAQVDGLREANARLNAQLAQAAAAQDELRASQAKNAESDAQAIALQAEIERLQVQAAALQAQAEAAQADVTRLQAELRASQERNQTEADGLRHENARLKAELAQQTEAAQAQVARLQAEADRLKAEAVGLIESNVRLLIEREENEARSKLTEERIKDLTDLLKAGSDVQAIALQAEIERLQVQAAALQAQAAAAQADVTRLQDELKASQAKNAESEAKAAAAQTQAVELRDANDRLKPELAQQAAELAQRQADVARLQTEAARLREENASSRDQILIVKKALKSKEDFDKTTNEELERIKAEKAALEANLEKARAKPATAEFAAQAVTSSSDAGSDPISIERSALSTQTELSQGSDTPLTRDTQRGSQTRTSVSSRRDVKQQEAKGSKAVTTSTASAAKPKETDEETQAGILVKAFNVSKDRPLVRPIIAEILNTGRNRTKNVNSIEYLEYFINYFRKMKEFIEPKLGKNGNRFAIAWLENKMELISILIQNYPKGNSGNKNNQKIEVINRLLVDIFNVELPCSREHIMQELDKCSPVQTSPGKSSQRSSVSDRSTSSGSAHGDETPPRAALFAESLGKSPGRSLNGSLESDAQSTGATTPPPAAAASSGRSTPENLPSPIKSSGAATPPPAHSLDSSDHREHTHSLSSAGKMLLQGSGKTASQRSAQGNTHAAAVTKSREGGPSNGRGTGR